VVSANRPTESCLPGIERQLRALADAGFAPRDGLLTLLTLNSFVIGDVLGQQAEEGQPRLVAESAVGGDSTAAAGPDGPYPLLRTAARELSSPDQRFEHGLGVLIDGLRACHAR
jgi:Tetracyclin repressor-like, C-terminal domain